MDLFFVNAIRILFAFLDGLLFHLFIMTYDLFNQIIGVNIFTNETIAKFSTRIYFMLGIFMILKLSFSFLSFAVSPDNIVNKDTGVGKLITNTFVVLILIGITPFVFGQAMRLQEIIVKDKLIENIILGGAASEPDFHFRTSPGQAMAHRTAMAFIRPNDSVDSIKIGCYQLTQPLSTSTSGMTLHNDCQAALSSEAKKTGSVGYYKTGIETGDYTYFYNPSVYLSVTNDGKALFDYLALGSTITLILMVMVFVGFTMDIALRTIKLGFLQLIAPIAIISYIDPKSSKNGMLSKWLKASVSTYLDLFMRIIAVNFALFIVGAITSTDQIRNPMIFIFIMIGAFMFAKQLPQLLGDMFGFKGGDFQLNPFKKIPAGANMALGAMAGAGLGALGGGVSRYQAARNLGYNRKQIAGAVASGLGMGFLGGGVSGFKGGSSGKIFSPGFKYGTGQGAKLVSQHGSTIGGRMAASSAKAFGINTAYENQQRRIDALDNASKIKEKLDSAALEDKNVRDAKTTYEDILATSKDTKEIEDAREFYRQIKNDYIRDSWNNPNTQVGAAVSDYNRTITQFLPEFSAMRITQLDATNVDTYGTISARAKTQSEIIKANPTYISNKAAHEATGGSSSKSTATAKKDK
jgi:hypothetical protein